LALQESIEKEGNFLFRYRSFLPLVIIVAGVAVFYFDVHQGAHTSDKQYEWVMLLSLLVSLFGLFIRIMAVGHTPANTSGRNTKEQLADEVNTTGIYSTVRHPLYLGNFFMWLGTAILIANWWFVVVFVLAYWIYYERIMYAEEQFLRRKFGVVYTNWASHTPTFIPSFRHFCKSSYPFSVKKILKKEKNGVLAIFVLLLLFQTIRLSLLYSQFTLKYNWVFWTFVASAFVYILLKVLKKHSTVLDETGR
jgi:protein-S-isoprenylcysteine O-methyltransferase Ste14